MSKDKVSFLQPGLNDIKAGIQYESIIVQKPDATGYGATDTTLDYDSADSYPIEHLVDIVKLVKAIMSSNLPAYELRKTLNRQYYSKHPWFARHPHPGLDALALAPHQDYDCHREIMAFFHALDSVGLDCLQLGFPLTALVSCKDGSSVPLAEKINQLVAAIRVYMLLPETLSAIKSCNSNANKNLKSAKKYVKALFRVFARLLVLRIDFAYRKECGPVSIERIKKDIERFLNNRRSNTLLQQIQGYIFKFEYGLQKGLHVHCLLFLDGSKHYKHEFLAQQYGEYWQDRITCGEGCFYNCHYAMNRYKKLCIGQIGHRDTEKMEALFVCLAYFNKVEQYIPPKMLNGYRSFNKGRLPQAPSGYGRPRSSA